MTEAVLKFLVGKLADIIDKEIELLGGVAKNVEQLQRELSRIQCCLRDADSKRKGDAKVQNWLNELRDVAYRIEDATDTFFLEFEDNRHKDLKFLEKFKRWRHKPMGLPVLHKLGTELEKIQKELEEISKSRFHYGIKQLHDKNKGEAIILPFRRATYQDLIETEVVGLQTDKNNILKLLCPEQTIRRAVITIVGTGGLGKTTLAHMVYTSARANFEYHIMLSISQQFSLIDILRKMLLSISQQFSLTEFLKKMLYQQKYTESENQDVGHLISNLNKELRTKRYLIILDDVWEVDMWNQLKVALPDVKNGSRVIMTSRFIDVAKSADSQMSPYELNFLDDKKSLNLLLKKVFPYQEPGEECPSYLLDLAKELSKKCRGLPLALVVIGGILSTKENSYPVWERVLRTINWHSDGKDCMRVLAMSYEDMPYYLKACFLYLASFPEDYEIPAKRLIRMWVAEGFIPQEERKTMEETAEDCLEQLFQRSMIHVSSRYMNGSIKSCQMHDLLRNLAMHEASQENFVTIFAQDSIVNQPNKRIRRASFHYSFQAQQGNPPLFEPPLKLMLQPRIEEYVGPNTRSLLLFGLHLSNCSYFRLLKVLEVVGVTSYTRDLKLDELMHLKYLGFRKCDMHVDFSSCSFHRMKTLETLDLRGTTAQLPNALWTIGTLRHVLCDSGSLDGPISTVDLRNLQTLRWVSPVIEWDRKLSLLNNLCNLGVNNSFEKWVTVTNLLQTLPFLVSLRIKGKSLPTEIVYPKALPNYQNLQSLYLEGTWSLEKNVTLVASLFPPYLVKLTLTRSRLQQNPMSELGKLKNLKKLCLREHALNYLGPTVCREGFPILQYLEVDDRGIKDLTVAQGVMSKLTYLQVHGNIQLHLPPELQQLQRRRIAGARLLPPPARKIRIASANIRKRRRLLFVELRLVQGKTKSMFRSGGSSNTQSHSSQSYYFMPAASCLTGADIDVISSRVLSSISSQLMPQITKHITLAVRAAQGGSSSHQALMPAPQDDEDDDGDDDEGHWSDVSGDGTT